MCTINIETLQRNCCFWCKAVGITYSMCLCSLSYQPCKAHASCYIVICSLSGSTILFYFMSQTARFFLGEKTLLNIKRLLILSTSFVWNISHSKENSRKIHFSCRIFYKLLFYGHIFEKYSNINFMEIVPVGAEFLNANKRKDGLLDRLTWQSS